MIFKGKAFYDKLFSTAEFITVLSSLRDLALNIGLLILHLRGQEAPLIEYHPD